MILRCRLTVFLMKVVESKHVHVTGAGYEFSICRGHFDVMTKLVMVMVFSERERARKKKRKRER